MSETPTLNTVSAQKHLARRWCGCEPTRLLMGEEHYVRLCEELNRELPDTLDYAAEVSVSRKILGLRIEIVPWMQGIVVLPPDREQ